MEDDESRAAGGADQGDSHLLQFGGEAAVSPHGVLLGEILPPLDDGAALAAPTPMPYIPNEWAKDYNAYRSGVVKGLESKALTGEVHDPELIAQQKAERKERRQKVREAIKQAQLASVLAARIAGMSREEITARFNLKRGQQDSLLAEAERDGLIQTAKDILVSRLVPKALFTYEHHLDGNNLEAARDVMKGLHVLNEKTPVQAPLQSGETEVTLRELRARFAPSKESL